MLTLSALPNECPLTSNDVLGFQAALSSSAPLLLAEGLVRNSRVRIARTKSVADGVVAAPAPVLAAPPPSLLSLFFFEVEVNADADEPPLEGGPDDDDALLVTRLLSLRVSLVRRELRPRRKGRLRGRCVCGDDPETV